MLVVWAAILSSSVSSPVPWRTIQALISKSHMTGGIVMVRLTRCQFMIRVNQPFSQKRSLMALQLINQYESTTQSWRPYLGIRFWLTNTEIFFSDSECIFQNFSEISETGSVTITETISGLVTMVTISFSKFNLLLLHVRLRLRKLSALHLDCGSNTTLNSKHILKNYLRAILNCCLMILSISTIATF